MMITYVTTCKNRWYHLKQTLPENLRVTSGNFVILDYGSTVPLDPYPDARVTIWRHTPTHNYFYTAHAKNLVARISKGPDFVCFLDADVFLTPEFEDLESEAKRPIFHTPLFSPNIGGLIVVPWSQFLELRGYDETFVNYAFDDVDFVLRAYGLHMSPTIIDPKLVRTIEHSDEERVVHVPNKDLVEGVKVNKAISLQNLANCKYSVNESGFGRGEVVRVS